MLSHVGARRFKLHLLAFGLVRGREASIPVVVLTMPPYAVDALGLPWNEGLACSTRSFAIAIEGLYNGSLFSFVLLQHIFLYPSIQSAQLQEDRINSQCRTRRFLWSLAQLATKVVP